MKNKVVAGILAILLGDLGIHKFYLGKIGWGIIYLLFCWTGIPAIVGLIEGIIYLCTDNETFQVKYCGSTASAAVNNSKTDRRDSIGSGMDNTFDSVDNGLDDTLADDPTSIDDNSNQM